MCVGVLVWLVEVVSVWQASACHTDTTPSPGTKPVLYSALLWHNALFLWKVIHI